MHRNVRRTNPSQSHSIQTKIDRKFVTSMNGMFICDVLVTSFTGLQKQTVTFRDQVCCLIEFVKTQFAP